MGNDLARLEEEPHDRAVLFSASMLASLVFGLVLHFALESPDLYSNVALEHGALFLHSAMGLALVEFVGFVLGAHVAIRSRRPAPGRCR